LTLFETYFGLDPLRSPFQPNNFVNISEVIDEKIKVLRVYGSELGAAPIPRSGAAVRASAQLRGASSGFRPAESFMPLKQVIP
jgi:hypothetical protein